MAIAGATAAAVAIVIIDDVVVSVTATVAPRVIAVKQLF